MGKLSLGILLVACCLSSLSCFLARAAGPVASTINASAFPSLQAAIDAIPPGGGTLIIDGQFNANTDSCLAQTGQSGPCIYQRQNIRILGDGVTSRIVATSSTSNGLYIAGSEAIRVSGVEFVGPYFGGQASGTGVAVRIDRSQRVTVESCRVHNFSFDGLWARNGTSQIHLLHNESYDNQGNGIEVEAQDSSILDNDSHDNEHQGFEIYSAASRVRVASNRAHHNAEGIKLIEDPHYATLSDITIMGNDVTDNLDSGILYQPITPNAPPGGLVTITGNVVTGNKIGIALIQSGMGFVIAQNVVSRNSSTDLYVSRPGEIIVSSNLFTVLPGASLPNYGIYIQWGSGHVQLADNGLNHSAAVPLLYPSATTVH